MERLPLLAFGCIFKIELGDFTNICWCLAVIFESDTFEVILLQY